MENSVVVLDVNTLWKEVAQKIDAVFAEVYKCPAVIWTRAVEHIEKHLESLKSTSEVDMGDAVDKTCIQHNRRKLKSVSVMPRNNEAQMEEEHIKVYTFKQNASADETVNTCTTTSNNSLASNVDGGVDSILQMVGVSTIGLCVPQVISDKSEVHPDNGQAEGSFQERENVASLISPSSTSDEKHKFCIGQLFNVNVCLENNAVNASSSTSSAGRPLSFEMKEKTLEPSKQAMDISSEPDSPCKSEQVISSCKKVGKLISQDSDCSKTECNSDKNVTYEDICMRKLDNCNSSLPCVLNQRERGEVKVKSKRGRPPKKRAVHELVLTAVVAEKGISGEVTVKCKRGRPPKAREVLPCKEHAKSADVLPQRRVLTTGKEVSGKVKRKRGRPPKARKVIPCKEHGKSTPTDVLPQRRRGHPRKVGSKSDIATTECHIQKKLSQQRDSSIVPVLHLPKAEVKVETEKAHDESIPGSLETHICPVCNRLMSGKQALKIHMLIHSGEKPYQCNLCGKSFRQRGGLVSHHRINHSEKIRKFACHFCPFKAVQKSTVVFHERNKHTNEKPYLCAICGDGFATFTLLKRHVAIVHERCRYYCDQCDHHTHLLSLLKTHKVYMHGPVQPEYPCSRCSTILKSKGSLVQHMRSHTGEKPYTCKECNKAFTGSNRLAAHRRIHQDRPKMCEYCKKRFIDNSNLLRHMSIHTGSKNFKCPKCSYSTYTKANLRKHCLARHQLDYPTTPQFMLIKDREMKTDEREVATSLPESQIGALHMLSEVVISSEIQDIVQTTAENMSDLP